MAAFRGLRPKAAIAAGALALALSGPATAQPAGEAAAIHACLCMEQSMASLSQEMTAKNEALDAVRRELADLDAQLRQEYPKVEVNNPQSEERYKALLHRRDAAYQRSLGPVYSQAATATARYNVLVRQYNERCAHRPFDSALMAQMRASLSCPAPR